MLQLRAWSHQRVVLLLLLLLLSSCLPPIQGLDQHTDNTPEERSSNEEVNRKLEKRIHQLEWELEKREMRHEMEKDKERLERENAELKAQLESYKSFYYWFKVVCGLGLGAVAAKYLPLHDLVENGKAMAPSVLQFMKEILMKLVEKENVEFFWRVLSSTTYYLPN